MAPIDKTFDVGLTVRAVTEEDFFLGADPLNQEVDQGVLAVTSVLLTGTFLGGINLTAENVPEGAVVTFEPVGPVFIGDVVTMSVATAAMVPGAYVVTIRAAAAV